MLCGHNDLSWHKYYMSFIDNSWINNKKVERYGNSFFKILAFLVVSYKVRLTFAERKWVQTRGFSICARTFYGYYATKEAIEETLSRSWKIKTPVASYIIPSLVSSSQLNIVLHFMKRKSQYNPHHSTRIENQGKKLKLVIRNQIIRGTEA